MPKDKPDHKVENKSDRYWIKAGVAVAHRDWPNRKMLVDEIKKQSKTIKDENGNDIRKKFVVGVDCHWFDDDGRYDKGRFLTMELIPFTDGNPDLTESLEPQEEPAVAVAE